MKAGHQATSLTAVQLPYAGIRTRNVAAASRPVPSVRHVLWRALPWLAALGLLVYTIAQLTRSLPSVLDWAALTTYPSLRSAAVFSAVFVGVVMIRAQRFATILAWHDDALRHPAVRVFPVLFFLGAVTPLRLGEAARIEWMRRHAGLPLLGVSSLVCERLADMTVLLLLLALGIWSLGEVSAGTLETHAAWAMAALVGLIYAGAVALGLRGPQREHGMWARLATGFAPLANLRRHAIIVLYTLAGWLPLVGAYFIVIRTFAPECSLGAAAFVLASVNLSYLISPVPANIGTFQAVAIGTLALFGIETTPALFAAIVIHVTNLAATTMLGAWGLFASRRRGGNPGSLNPG